MTRKTTKTRTTKAKRADKVVGGYDGRHAMSAPLTITKLESCEDTELQATLARLADADQRFGRDMALQGALPQTVEDWARLFLFVDQAAPAPSERVELAYLGGVAVGLRLARLDSGVTR